MSGQLKEVRVRIKSVQSTQQITKAMKMVSAAKLRKAQESVTQFRIYANQLREIYLDIKDSLGDGIESNLLALKSVSKVGILVISSDKGLCGGYNANIVKNVQGLIATKYSTQYQAGAVELICVGKKAFDFFQRRNYTINSEFKNILQKLDYQNVYKLAQFLLNSFLHKQYDVIEVVYSEFQNAATQIIGSHVLLPFHPLDEYKSKKTNQTSKTSVNQRKVDFIFQSKPADLLEMLIPQIVNAQVLKAILDAVASEHGARMTAMDKATDNSNEILRQLKINYNRARQATITTELNEIVAGSVALEQ